VTKTQSAGPISCLEHRIVTGAAVLIEFHYSCCTVTITVDDTSHHARALYLQLEPRPYRTCTMLSCSLVKVCKLPAHTTVYCISSCEADLRLMLPKATGYGCLVPPTPCRGVQREMNSTNSLTPYPVPMNRKLFAPKHIPGYAKSYREKLQAIAIAILKL